MVRTIIKTYWNTYKWKSNLLWNLYENEHQLKVHFKWNSLNLLDWQLDVLLGKKRMSIILHFQNKQYMNLKSRTDFIKCTLNNSFMIHIYLFITKQNFLYNIVYRWNLHSLKSDHHSRRNVNQNQLSTLKNNYLILLYIYIYSILKSYVTSCLSKYIKGRNTMQIRQNHNI